MKSIHYLLTILFLSAASAFGQVFVNWKTQKNVVFRQTGINTEGHKSSFSTQIFKHNNQFVELEGGAGTFAPNDNEGQILSSGLTFNKGSKRHFLSLGLHMTYASNSAIEFNTILNQQAYLSNALIGYHYSTGKVDFKVHFQPLNGISQRITDLGSSASINIQL